jgi:geranylgeranyl diphosphate synthase type II
MDSATRIEQALARAIQGVDDKDCPPGLAQAVRYSVFPRGARVRPRLCLAVARACGDDDPHLADAAAAAIELLHCASLVHDDLPCFDDAATRRGKPTVHRAFGERLAVLSGDALIVLCFQTLGRAAERSPQRLPGLLAAVGRAGGLPYGIAAGQSWECEAQVDLAAYQRAKTGALFAAATVAGAQAAGAVGERWRALGEFLGEAYQVADDLKDVLSSEEEIGKPVGRDLALGRPNAALQLTVPGAIGRLGELADAAIAAIPPCPGVAELRALIRLESQRLMPKNVALRAA